MTQPTTTAARDELVAFLDETLEIAAFSDYGPNGMQVVGAERVALAALAVSSTLECFEQAAALGAQLLVVHHGLFWEGASRTIDALQRRRLQALFAADVTLAAYHLPLDAHPVLGNNARLADALGVDVEGWFAAHGGRPLAAHGRLREPVGLDELAARVEGALGRRPLAFAGGPEPVRTIGICSGGAGRDVEEAARRGLDAYLTGEPEEASRALARELGISFLAAGHHATERPGVRAVGELLERTFGIETAFIDAANPV